MGVRVPKNLTFYRCEYAGISYKPDPGVILKLTTDRDEVVLIIVPFDSLHCVTASMRQGMNAYKSHVVDCSRWLEENAKETP